MSVCPGWPVIGSEELAAQVAGAPQAWKSIIRTAVTTMAVVLSLVACSTAEINRRIDGLNQSIKGNGQVSLPGLTVEPATAAASLASTGAVNFRRHMPAGPDIVRPPIEGGAMQLRIGQDFTPSQTVDNAMPYHWSASCDMFYLVTARLPGWRPPADNLSKFSMDEACALNEAGLAHRHSTLDDPIRRRPAPVLSTSFGVSDTIAQWRPRVSKRRGEIAAFDSSRYFFVGAKALEIQPYDPSKQGFFVSVDLDTGYAWEKPIVLVGSQLSNQRFKVQLKVDEALARLIDESRGSNARIPAREALVVFKLNGVRDAGPRIELNVTIEKLEVPVYKNLTVAPVVVNLT